MLCFFPENETLNSAEAVEEEQEEEGDHGESQVNKKWLFYLILTT